MAMRVACWPNLYHQPSSGSGPGITVSFMRAVSCVSIRSAYCARHWLSAEHYPLCSIPVRENPPARHQPSMVPAEYHHKHSGAMSWSTQMTQKRPQPPRTSAVCAANTAVNTKRIRKTRTIRLSNSRTIVQLFVQPAVIVL